MNQDEVYAPPGVMYPDRPAYGRIIGRTTVTEKGKRVELVRFAEHDGDTAWVPASTLALSNNH